MILTHEEEIAGLKTIVKNLYEKMNINIAFYERGLANDTADLDGLKQYLHSCNNINMDRIDSCISRMKEI